ncbi:hypothetical protein [Hyella patelloides]|uniref:hypothetical protein n=1 Tax=Hyella patelloides TaxID=1982969 RepID=UPI001643C978|nr:hypothetical protein [Hyella patelloides]
MNSSPEPAHYPKTVIVVVVVAPIVVVAGSGTAVFWLIVPGTAPQLGSPNPYSMPRKDEVTEYLLP